MGYCYLNGSLCCDLCNKPGATKQRCPFGWCQPLAACSDCKRNRPEVFQAAKHRELGCEAQHKRFAAERKAEAEALERGEFVLIAGLSYDRNTVHAIFKSAAGERGAFVPAVIYEQRKTPQTLADFEALAGAPLPDAPTGMYPQDDVDQAYHRARSAGFSALLPQK